MSIFIDDRAGSKDLIGYSPLDSIAELCHLESGDILMIGNGPRGEISIGIEFKSVSDLVSSRRNGRLQGAQDSQAVKMVQDYEERWILTYGAYRCGHAGHLEHPKKVKRGSRVATEWCPYMLGSSPVLFAYFESTIISLGDAGFRHHHTYDITQAVRWLCALYGKRSKPWDKQCKMFRSFNQSGEITESAYQRLSARLGADSDISPLPAPVDPVEYQIAKTASSFSPIKYERAMNIAKHFNSVEEMILASPQEWAKIDGVGKVIAKSVTDSIRRKKIK